MVIECTCVYNSSACNRTPNAVDWSVRGKICYGACNAVHIYSYADDVEALHLQTLVGHSRLVTSVHWTKTPDKDFEDELISTSADSTAIIWKSNGTEFHLSSLLAGHTNVVRKAASIHYSTEGKDFLRVATLSTDSTVKIWLRESDSEVLCVQTLSLNNGFALDAKFTSLQNQNEIILVMAKDDAKIHLYVQNEDGLFVPSVKLVGHEDWIHSLDIVKESENDWKIASASQDCHIRIWKVSPYIEDASNTDLKVDATVFKTKTDRSYTVTLESVLSGHENWIYSIRWHSSKSDNGGFSLLLLSSSMDKSLIIWETDSNIWLEKVRVGEVGGNTLGFYGAVFSPDGGTILAHGHQGAIHIWKLNKKENLWQPSLSFGGHYAPVQDIDWDPDGELLLSCSSDQTTRLHAPFVAGTSWYEMARPQIHGYDMVCLSVLDRFKFVSAGDEKVLRVFEAPRSFAEALRNLTNLDTLPYVMKTLAEGASVPSLGLSNKAVFEEDIKKSSSQESDLSRHPKDRYPDFYYIPTLLNAPPTEDTLLQNTLWPETQKLYGHPYEVFTVACNHGKTIVASACKASKVEHAGIMLWDTTTWKQVAYLAFHTLTITQIEFSPDDQYLLSVSRDRMWALYKFFPNDSAPYKLVGNMNKKSGVHTRIIWSCSWSFDSQHFVTTSRDKKVAVWAKNAIDSEIEEFSLCGKVLEVEDSATAVTVAPCLVSNQYLIAVGLENGCILLNSWSISSGWSSLQKLNNVVSHHLNINRLKFSPKCGEAGKKEKDSNVLQLASCSNDCHVKVYNVHIR